MAIVVGPQIGASGTSTFTFYIVRPPDGTDGARSNALTSGDSGFAASQVDELAGKIGPIIEPYDPEGKK